MELRVIIHGPMDPQFNMAIDEAMLLAIRESSSPILRLYMWKPTGVSLGRRQRVDETVNMDKIRDKGYVLVRRPTGGAALIHGEGAELTYSFVAPRNNVLYNLSIDESASRISSGIALALKRLGVDARIGGFSGSSREENLCYLRVGASDVTINGRKISGSAQVRNSHGLLQHGTLLIEINYKDWVDIIKTASDEEELQRAVTSLKGIGVKASLKDIVDAVISGFSEALGLTPVFSSISPVELEIAHELYRVKYSNPQWNIEGKPVYRHSELLSGPQ